MKKLLMLFCSLCLVILSGCQTQNKQDVNLLIAAAASLENCYEDELIPLFEEKHPYIQIEGTYDSSGKLQTQIEEGLHADIFMSAATKQMNALNEEGYIAKDSIINLLENELVLITNKNSQTNVKDFYNIQDASVIAIGDPDSVPAGQYAKEALESIGNYESVLKKSSLGTNVTEVLSWVEAQSAEVGIVYASDATSSQNVKILASLPEGILKTSVIYPVGILENSQHQEEAKLFVKFLQGQEAKEIFEKYGFKVK